MVPALVVEDLSYFHGRRKVLDHVSFTVLPGQCVILLGPNGAGKTTLFSLITRFYEFRAGSLSIAGYELRTQAALALQQIGVVFQQSTLDLDLSIVQNLRYHADLHGLSRRLADERITEELERQGIYERRKETVRQLNGGHRRRVEIARALLHHPRLLLLDEPTVGLDVPSRIGVISYIHKLARSTSIAVLWATHLIDEIDTNDHLVILHMGKIRAIGTIPSVLKNTGTSSIHDAFATLTRFSQ